MNSGLFSKISLMLILSITIPALAAHQSIFTRAENAFDQYNKACKEGKIDSVRNAIAEIKNVQQQINPIYRFIATHWKKTDILDKVSDNASLCVNGLTQSAFNQKLSNLTAVKNDLIKMAGTNVYQQGLEKALLDSRFPFVQTPDALKKLMDNSEFSKATYDSVAIAAGRVAQLGTTNYLFKKCPESMMQKEVVQGAAISLKDAQDYFKAYPNTQTHHLYDCKRSAINLMLLYSNYLNHTKVLPTGIIN